MPIDNGDVSRAVTMGGKIYVAGDLQEGYDVDLRHRHRNVDQRPPMSQNKSGGFLLPHDGKIYYAGGQTTNSVATNVLRGLRSVNRHWTTLAPLPVTWLNGTMAAIGGKFYLVPGLTNNGQPSDAVYMYDPALNTWTAKTSLHLARYAFESAVVNNKLFIMGGVTSNIITTRTDRVQRV